eukprot:tig00021571_g22380.t1
METTSTALQLDAIENNTDRLAQLSRRLALEGRNEELLATETAARAKLLGHEKLLMSKDLEASARYVKELLERARSDEISLLGLRQENVNLKERVKSLADAEIERETEKRQLMAAIGEAQVPRAFMALITVDVGLFRYTYT